MGRERLVIRDFRKQTQVTRHMGLSNKYDVLAFNQILFALTIGASPF